MPQKMVISGLILVTFLIMSWKIFISDAGSLIFCQKLPLELCYEMKPTKINVTYTNHQMLEKAVSQGLMLQSILNRW